MNFRFDPETLGYIFTKSAFFWLFETAIQKGFFYFFNFGNPPFFELLCYTGYKFVILCLIVIVQLIGGYLASYVAFGVLGLVYCLFFFKTLGRFNSGNTLADHISLSSGGGNFNKKTFMFINSIAQLFFILVLSYN